MPHSFEWYTVIPGLNLLGHHAQVAHAIIVALFIILLAWMANRRLAAQGEDLVPSSRLSLTNFFELIYESLYGVMKDVLGSHTRQFMPLLGSLSVFILFSNLLGLIPGFVPPTDNINTTAACAMVVFLATHYYGLKTHGLAYFKQFAGPFWWLSWLMIPIEIISHLARPLSLSLRLFGNLFGDHMVAALFVFMAGALTKTILSGTVFIWPFALLSPFIPFVVFLLGLFVALVQTFVFLLLSMTYISGAVSDHH